MIRRAKHSDLESIYSLYKQHQIRIRSIKNDLSSRLRIQHTGFIMGDESAKDFDSYVAEDRFFYVYEEKGEILGFINGFTDPIHQGTWSDGEAQNHYYHSSASHSVDRLVISKEAIRNGIGSKLLRHFEHALRTYGYKYLFSFVKVYPLTNIPSLQFHLKNDFQQVSISLPHDVYPLKNVVDLLFFKSL